MLEVVVPVDLLDFARRNGQRGLPELAKDPARVSRIEQAVRGLPTKHHLVCGDARSIDTLPDDSIHLVVTSPPYWTLKQYPKRAGQLGYEEEYDRFLDQLDLVWAHIFRALVPGGRLVIVVGDVCVARRSFGRHMVFPLHASIQERCRNLGFDNLAPIIWYKIANARLEVQRGSRFMGKPYEPNGIVKNDIEYILFQRKPGGYRQPSLEARVLSLIPASCHQEWFQQIWHINGASTRNHPAPFPIGIAERLVRMFSYVGDTVLDPFMGTGTTNHAASRWGRHSIGVDIEPSYVRLAHRRLEEEAASLFANIDVHVQMEPKRS